MKNILTLLGIGLAVIGPTGTVLADGPIIPTTDFTRGLLRAANAAAARSTLGVLATNNWPITGAVLQVPILNGGTWSNPTNIGGVYSNGLFLATSRTKRC